MGVIPVEHLFHTYNRHAGTLGREHHQRYILKRALKVPRLRGGGGLRIREL